MATISVRTDDTLTQQTEFSNPFYSNVNQAILSKSIAEYEAGRAKTVTKSLEELEAMAGE